MSARRDRSEGNNLLLCCWSFVILFLLLLLAPSPLHAQQHRRRENDNDWYTRYPAYPPYCSTPEEMARRRVPDLSDDPRLGETRLQHVTAILRHGARTPWKAGINCWEDYATNPETAVWDCNLTTYLSPPPPERVTEEGAAVGSDEAMFLFEKRYDALQSPQYNISNFLQGSCQIGQLLLQGYEQEFKNGQFLRDAYAYDESKYDHDARMRLLDITKEKNRHVWDDIYYRVDDEIRTLMSGQVVLRGVMGPEMDSFFQAKKYYPVIPLHTADKPRDIVDPNHNICPRLSEIAERNQQSQAFQALNQSAEALELRQFQRNVLKVPRPDQDMDAIDCLMTTLCTDRPLPEAVNDYQAPPVAASTTTSGDDNAEEQASSSNNNKGYFERLYEFDVELYVNNLKANDAEYSKLAMGPLWYEMMDKIYPHISDQHVGDHFKLAVYAGHDTTIMPVLAALAPDLWPDKEWPPYASMVLLEIHEVNIDGGTDRTIFRTNYAFRLLYNGQVLTHKIEACPDDLDMCDVEILLDRVDEFARLDADCQRQHEQPVAYKDAVSRAQEILSTTEGIVSFLVLVLGSAAIGGVTVYVYLTQGGFSRHRRRGHRPVGEVMGEDGIFMTGSGANGTSRYHDETDADML